MEKVRPKATLKSYDVVSKSPFFIQLLEKVGELEKRVTSLEAPTLSKKEKR